MKTALIAIDIQNAFVTDDTKDLPSKIAKHIKNTKYDFVLFTQFINKPDSNFVKQLGYKDCVSSPEIDMHPAIVKYANLKNTFKKTSYSAFKAKGFKEFLEKNKITKIFLCGFDSDSCVLATAYDAFDLGYKVKVLEDLCKSSSGSDFDKAGKKIINQSI